MAYFVPSQHVEGLCCTFRYGCVYSVPMGTSITVDTIGERLTIARMRRGVTKKALAEAVGIERRTLARWEANKSVPDLDSSVKIAGVLQVDLLWLAGLPDGEAPEPGPAVGSSTPRVRQLELVGRADRSRARLVTVPAPLVGDAAA